MAANRDLRSSYTTAVYNNFSSHSCIAAEISFLKEARATGDELLADFLELNIPRRKKRAMGLSVECEVLGLGKLVKENSEIKVRGSDALLVATADGVHKCAAPYERGAHLESPFSWALTLCQDNLEDADGMFGKECLARLRTADLRHRALEAKEPFDALRTEYERFLSEIHDYLPARFDFCNLLLVGSLNKSIELADGDLESAFTVLLNKTLEIADIPVPAELSGEDLGSHILLSAPPMSAAPLAWRQLSAVRRYVSQRDGASERAGLDFATSRFDVLL